jgi:hypothetical protein
MNSAAGKFIGTQGGEATRDGSNINEGGINQGGEIEFGGIDFGSHGWMS